MRIKKALVTGASGFIGKNLCAELVRQGVETIAIVRKPNSLSSIPSGTEKLREICCDLSGFKNLANYVEDRDIDVCFHLAWNGSAGTLRGDYGVQLDNARYTCDTVQACYELGCKRFVFASSIMEYEIAALMETDYAPGIASLYSSAKIVADYMARALSAKCEIEYIRAVISNIYGPGESSPRLINTTIRKMLKGEHCSFSSGEQMYDFIYIDDAVREFIAIGASGKGNGTYYIGSLSPKPLKEFLIELRDVVNPKIEIGLGELPFTGVTLNYKEFDIFAVKNDMGVTPVIPFSEGIKKTMTWIKEAGL